MTIQETRSIIKLCLRNPNFLKNRTTVCDVLRLVNIVYRITEVFSTTRYREGVIFLYKKYEELLIKTGKTSYQVSKDTGIAQSTISDWKTGRSNPKLEKLQILADYFGVPITYFIGGD